MAVSQCGKFDPTHWIVNNERAAWRDESPKSDNVGCRHLTDVGVSRMSASLIGHLGSSTFRLSTTTVSMSRAGSCFSSESAPGPFHHGIRGRGGTIFTAALPSDDGRYKRTCELTSSIVPRGTSFHGLVELRVFSYRIW